jgi:hypothetical protein
MGSRPLALVIWILFSVIVASGLSFCASPGSPVLRPWEFPSWSHYTFFFVSGTALNPDYTDGTLYGLVSMGIDTSGMDQAAISKTSLYRSSLPLAINDRARCGMFFSFDANNNIMPLTLLLGNIRDKAYSGGESGARFLYENPDAASMLGLHGVKHTSIDSNNETVTHYYIDKVGPVVATISPSEAGAFISLVNYYNMGSDAGNISSASNLLTRAAANGYSVISSDMLTVLSIWDSSQACIRYKSSYANATEALLSLYDYSSSAAMSNMSNLSQCYQDMEYKGFCNRSYTGVGSQLCRQLEAEVLSNATYYSSFISEDAKLREAGGSIPPNLSHAVRGINLMWRFIYSNSGSAQAYAQKTAEFDRALFDAKKAAESNISAMQKAGRDLDAQDLDKITEIYIPEGATRGNVQNIIFSHDDFKARAASISEKKAALDGLADPSAPKLYGWAADAYTGYVSVAADAGAAVSAADATLYYAGTTVSFLRNQSMSIAEMKKAEGYNVSGILQYIADGDRAATLGLRFVSYRNAYLLALSLSASEATRNETDTLALLKSEIQTMLGHAKDDGIDVSSEQAEFNMYKDNANTRLAIEHMNGIKQSILAKVQTMYSDLPGTRRRIYSYLINDRGGVLDSVALDISQAEAGIVSGSSIDYYAGLGHLKVLRIAYAKAESDIDKLILQYLESSIVPSVEYSAFVPTMNEQATLYGSVTIRNPLPMAAENLKISFQPAVALTPSDIPGAVAAVQGSTVTISLASLGPLETKEFEFSKTAVFAAGSLESRKAEGRNGDATIKDTWLVEVSAPLDGLNVGSYDKVSLNGRDYRGGRITRAIGKGTHEIYAQNTVDNAYSVSESQNVTETDQQAVISRTIRITPTMRLDTVAIAKETACKVKGSSYDYEDKGTEVSLNGVESAGSMLLECTYARDTVSGSIDRIVGAMGRINLTSSESGALDRIILLVGAGQNSTALSELLALNRTVEQRLANDKKTVDSVSKQLAYMDNEIAMLSEAISLAESLNHSSYLVEMYYERRASVSSLRERAVSAGSSAGPIISGYDSDWSAKETSKWLTQAFQNFTKLEKAYNDNGFSDLAIDQQMSLFRQSYVKARGAEGNLTYAVLSSYYLQGTDGLLGLKLSNLSSALDRAKSELALSISDLTSQLEDYTAVYNDAKQNKADPYMPRGPKYFESAIAAMGKASTEAQIKYYLNRSASLGTEMSSEIQGISRVAQDEISNAELAFEQNQGMMAAGDAANAESSISKAKSLAKDGKYGSAIALAKEVSSGLAKLVSDRKESDTRLMAIGLLLVGSVAVIGYGYRDAIGSLLGTRKGKIALRKLKKGEDEGQE